MADIRFCEPEFRGEVLNLLTQVAGPFVTEWLCFENQPAVCKRNAWHRARETGQRDYLQEEKSIERLTIHYEPFPEGATVLLVKEASASLRLRIRSILQTLTRRSIPD